MATALSIHLRYNASSEDARLNFLEDWIAVYNAQISSLDHVAYGLCKMSVFLSYSVINDLGFLCP